MSTKSTLDFKSLEANRNVVSRNYWKNRLEDFEFKSYFSKADASQIEGYDGRSYTYSADKAMADLLKKIAPVEKAQHIILMSALVIFIKKYASEEDIAILTPEYSTSNAETNQVFPVRLTDICGSFKDILGKVKEQIVTDFRHNNYPLDKMLQSVDQTISISKTAMLVAGAQEADMIKSYQSEILLIFEIEEKLSLKIVFNSKSIDSSEVELLPALFFDFLAKLIHSKDQNIDEVSLISDDQLIKINKEFNATDSEFPINESVISLFERQVSTTPENVAVQSSENSLTYRELRDFADTIAAILRDKNGIKKGDMVGLLLPRDKYLMPSILAILKLGASYVPIDFSHPLERIRYILADSDVNAVVTSSSLSEITDQLSGVNLIDVASIEATENIVSIIDCEPESMAYMIYTSGSTGNPKGVMLNHRNVVNFIYGVNQKIDFSRGKSMLCLTTVSFDIFVLESFLPLLRGLKVVLVKSTDQTDANVIAGLIKNDNIDFVQVTPSHLKMLLTDCREKAFFKKIKTLMVGGEAFSLLLLKQLKYYYSGKIFNMYGPTETTVWSTIKELTVAEQVNIGKPIANTTIRIVDENFQMQPIGVAGELCIGGEGVAMGYWNREELTQEKFVKDPYISDRKIYRTGDMVYWLPDGDIHFIGRVDDEVKIRGHRVKLGEIEAVMSQYEDILDSSVITRGEEEDREIVGYYIPEGDISQAALRTFMMEKLPDYMMPAHFVSMDAFSLNASGKIDKQNFPEPEIIISNEYMAPSTEMEAQLVRIWSEILKLEKEEISVNASFFELGGHSLKAVTLVNKIKGELGYDISVKAVFDYADIVSLSKLLEVSEKHDTVDDMKHVETKEYYEASVAQKRVYYLHELDPSSLTFNLPMVAKLKGELDKNKLNEVFAKLMDRHETLHTYFKIREEKPVQVIGDKQKFEVEHYNVAETEVDETINKFIRVFDLSKAPLFRGALIETAEDVHYLAVDMHHIISDGTSLGLLIRDFMALYNDIELPQLEFSYKDYAEWQHSNAYQQRTAGQKDYWVEKFAEPLEPLDIPVDYSDFSQMATAKGDLVAFTLGPEDTKKLRKVVEKETVTISMMVMSALKIMLSKLSGQEDVSVGMTVAGRELIELEGMIGMFPIVLPIRTQPKGELTFKEYLDSLKSTFLGALDNQAYPYEDLARELKVERSSGRNPWFDVMYLYQNFERSSLSVPGLEVSQHGEHTIVEHEKLNLTVGESEDQIVFRFTYSTALFKRETIEKFAEYFRKIILRVAVDIQVKLNDLDIIDEKEKVKVLSEFNNTEVAYPKGKSLIESFEQKTEEIADSIAVVFNEHQISYDELNIKVNRIAHLLHKDLQLKTNDFAMIYMPKSQNTVSSILSIWKAGAAYVPVDISTPEKRLCKIIEDIRPKVVFTDPDSLETLQRAFVIIGFEIPCFVFDSTSEINFSDSQQIFKESLLTKYDDANLNINHSEDNLAYAIYTSGSTGAAKAVTVKHQSYTNAAYAWRDEYRLDEMPVNVLQIASYAFDVFAGDLARTFLNGGKLVICPDEERMDFGRLSKLLIDNKISLFESTPALVVPLMNYIEENTLKLNDLRLLIIGSDVCKFIDFKAITRYFEGKARVINSYGLTEATIDTSYYESTADNMPDSGTVPIGKPMPNMKFYILDKALNIQPIGVEGEIYIAGAGVAKGYFNREDLTRERFVENPFDQSGVMCKTGDTGKWLPDGNVQIVGRADNQVKIRGFRIEPGEIEQVLKENDSIDHALVIVKDEGALKSLVAYYVSDEEIELEMIKSFLFERLPDYMVPTYLVHVHEIPLTPNGKIDHRSLPDPEVDAGVNYVKPVGEVETKLVDIWSEVLQLDPEKVSVELSFFFMGGHSLNAIALVNKVYKEFDINIALKDFFVKPTIRAMAGFIEDFLWLNKKLENKNDNKNLVTL